MFTFPDDEIALTKEIISFARELPEPIAKQFLLQVYRLYIDWKFQLEELETRLQMEATSASDEQSAAAE